MPLTPESEEIRNPQTSAERLGQIAASRPDLAAAIAAHPNAYEGLLDWIAAHGDDEAKAAVAARRAPAAPTAPVAPPVPPVAEVPSQPAPAAPTQPVMPAQPVAPPAWTGTAPAWGPGAPAGQPTPGYGAAPAYPGAAPGYAGAPMGYPGAPAPAKKSRKPLIITLIAVVVVAALVAGGLFVYNTFFRGSNSPAGAVEQLIDSTLAGDSVGMFTAIAPSEIASLREAFETLSEVQIDDSVDYQQLASRVGDALQVTKEGFTFEEEDIAEGIKLVRMTAGRITINGDASRLAELMGDVIAQQTRATLEQFGYSEAEIEDAIEDATFELQRTLEDALPFTFDVEEDVLRNLPDGTPSPLAVVVVDEGGWYISPMMTVAELVHSYALPYAYGAPERTPQRGTTIVPAKSFDTPQAAMEGFTDAIEQFWRNADILTLAEVLPLAERRLLSIYGPSFMSDGARSWLRSDDSGSLSFDTVEIDATITGDRAEAGIDLIELTYQSRYDAMRLSLHGICATADNGYGSQTACLDDAPALRALELDKSKLVLTKEASGWLFNPTATIGEIAARTAKAYAKLVEEDRLDELVWY